MSTGKARVGEGAILEIGLGFLQLPTGTVIST